jgi:hypothetical protein
MEWVLALETTVQTVAATSLSLLKNSWSSLVKGESECSHILVASQPHHMEIEFLEFGWRGQIEQHD